MKQIGTVLKNGYRHITKGNSRKNPVRNYEHRMVMEQFLGRKLLPHEQVHHKNHNKLDNRIKNLEVVDKGKHQSIHAVENGLGKDRKGVPPVNKLSKEKINYIIKLRKTGMLLNQICHKTKASYPTVQKYSKYENYIN